MVRRRPSARPRPSSARPREWGGSDGSSSKPPSSRSTSIARRPGAPTGRRSSASTNTSSDWRRRSEPASRRRPPWRRRAVRRPGWRCSTRSTAPPCSTYQPFWAVRAHLLRQAGDGRRRGGGVRPRDRPHRGSGDPAVPARPARLTRPPLLSKRPPLERHKSEGRNQDPGREANDVSFVCDDGGCDRGGHHVDGRRRRPGREPSSRKKQTEQGERHVEEQGESHGEPERASRLEDTPDRVPAGVGSGAPEAPRQGEGPDPRP